MSLDSRPYSSPDPTSTPAEAAPHEGSTGRSRAVFAPDPGAKPRNDWFMLSLKAAPFIALHLLALCVIWTPLTTTAIVLFCVTYAVRVFGLTGGYHRYFAHRAYSTSRVFQFMIAFMGAMAVQKGPLWWAGHHRSHHRYSDTPQDPHSPYETTFWWSHVGWILSSEHSRTPHEDIQDFSRFPELRLLDVFHWVPGVMLAIACYLIGGWPGLVYGFLISTLAVYHVTFAINSLNHLMGSRRYATDDDSRNNVWLALLTFGEGWHNNHHHYQSSANQGFFWWEIDITYSTLVVLSWFGIVWDLRRPGEKALNHRLIKPPGKATPLDQVAATAAEGTNGEGPGPVGTGPETPAHG